MNNILIRNGICIEVLETISSTQHIIRTIDNQIAYIDDEQYSSYTLSELVELCEDLYINDQPMTEHTYNLYIRYMNVINSMRIHYRTDVIDNLFGEKKRTFTGMDPLGLAC